MKGMHCNVMSLYCTCTVHDNKGKVYSSSCPNLTKSRVHSSIHYNIPLLFEDLRTLFEPGCLVIGLYFIERLVRGGGVIV